MSLTKTLDEIEKMRRGGQLLSRALKAAVDSVCVGTSLRVIDAIGEQVIREGGGVPSFKGYRSHPSDTPFPSTICLSVNAEIVHGLGNRDLLLHEGDVLGLDIGCWFEGLCTDMAVTVAVGKVSPEIQQLITITRASLFAGVEAVRVGNTIRDVSSAIEKTIAPYGYGIVRALVGHGVGHAVHEPPHVPNYVDDRYPRTEIVEGMCLAIEPMVALGDYHVETAEDDWAIVMKDRSIGAHFEVTIAVTKNGIEVLTPLPVTT